MQAIQDSRISYDGALYKANCLGCGTEVNSKYKLTIRRMLANGSCRACRKDYRADSLPSKNAEGRFVSHCPSCGVEQGYTRADHARNSERQGWLCRKCSNSSKNKPVGDKQRLYNRFRKSANNRGIAWSINFDDFCEVYDGTCALTGWEINMDYGTGTASLDRIDSTKGYEKGNVQWVHTMVNMSKNKYTQCDFVKMCEAVADKTKW